MGSLIGSLAWAKQGRATTARAVSLSDLVRQSSRIARSTPLDSFARHEQIGGMKHIVTYSRLRVDEQLHGASQESEILVRTLGGQVGDVAEIVHGEALLALNEECLVFLRKNSEGIEHVTEMAQGHYPMLKDPGGARLLASPNMPHLLRASGSAVARLSGLRFVEARGLILGARP